jgi:DNA replication licensing factor MCM6
MFVRRVNEDQEETQDGVEEEELLVWYLEQKENEMETQEDLENERSLAKKVLKKVVKVCYLPSILLVYMGFALTLHRSSILC